MCMSPDEMSDDRIREIIGWNQENLEEALINLADGVSFAERNVRLYEARIANFQALLDEREQQRQADIDEILAPVFAEQATPLRETVTV